MITRRLFFKTASAGLATLGAIITSKVNAKGPRTQKFSAIRSSKPCGLNGAWEYEVKLNTGKRIKALELGSGKITRRLPNGTRVFIKQYMPEGYYFTHN